jgi:hypothetical protein
VKVLVNTSFAVFASFVRPNRFASPPDWAVTFSAILVHGEEARSTSV